MIRLSTTKLNKFLNGWMTKTVATPRMNDNCPTSTGAKAGLINLISTMIT